MTSGIDYREEVLDLVRAQVDRQNTMYPDNHLLAAGFGSSVQPYPWLSPYSEDSNGEIEAAFRADYGDYECLNGRPTWMHLIREEVAELFNTRTPVHAIEEAVQIAALCVSLCEQMLANTRETQPLSDIQGLAPQ